MAGISRKRIKYKDGREVVKYSITYRDIYGKQHTYGIYDTIKEAKVDLEKFQELKTSAPSDVTLGALIETFMKRARIKYAKNTVRAYESYINKYLNPLYDVKYKKLNSLVLQNLFDEWECVAPCTAHNILKFCKGAINYCMRKKLIKYNIFNELEHIKRPHFEAEHLEFEEVILILQKCKELFPQHYAMLFLLLGGGLRIGEAIALEISDYFPRYIMVNKQYTADQLEYHPKTASSNRKVYLFDILSEVLSRHIETLPEECKLLFPNEAGNYINPSNFRNRVWKRLLKECGITKRVRIHDTRGSYIDITLEEGLNSKFTQNNVGHSRNSTTMDIYAKVNEGSIERALRVLNDKFSEKCEQNVSKKENSNVISFTERLAKTRTKKEP